MVSMVFVHWLATSSVQRRKVTVGGVRENSIIVIDGLKIGHVHELRLEGVRSTDGEPLLHKDAYYTLNRLPKD